MKKLHVFHQKSLLALASTLALAANAQVNTTQDSSASAQAEQDLDAIVIIGSSQRDTRALQSVSPVQVISSQRIEETGSVTLTQALQKLVPSFNFPQGRSSNVGIITASSSSLRGLSPDHTLILVNGKRRHRGAQVQTPGLWGRGSQPVDINTIPIALVERVEVLTDGASAQYGSDAIAGVVNIVLKEKSAGGEVNAQVGQFAQGDGFGHVVSGWKGIELAEDGFLTLAIQHADSDRANRRARDYRQQYLPVDAQKESAEGRNWSWGTPAQESTVLGFNGEFNLQPQTSLYAFGTYNHRTSNAGSLPVRPLQDNNIRAIYPDGFQTTKKVNLDDYHLAAGVRHETTFGEFDLGATTGKAVNEDYSYESLNPSLGLNSPTSFYQGKRESKQSGIELSYRKTIETSYAQDPISLLAGVGWRKESWSQTAGDDASWINGGALILDGPNAGNAAAAGEPAGTGLRPVDNVSVNRNVRSIYASLEQNVLEKLRLSAAVRGEKYSDFGSSLTGKLSARYELSPTAALRGTVSTGFRAPSLGQTSLQTTSIQFDRDTVTRFLLAQPGSQVARLLGASNLKEEESTNLSLGLVLRPTENTAFTVDAYQITVDDAVVLSGNLEGSYVQSVLNASGNPDIKRVQYFTNALKYRTRGIDLTARHRQSLGSAGLLNLSAGYSYNSVKILNVKQPAAVAAAGLNILGDAARGLITSVNPRHKATFSANYAYQDWSLTLTERYNGKFTVLNDNPALSQTFSDRWLTDLDIAYRFTPNLRVAIGAINLFDDRGEKAIPANWSGTFGQYGGNDPEGNNGAFYYVRLNYRF